MTKLSLSLPCCLLLSVATTACIANPDESVAVDEQGLTITDPGGVYQDPPPPPPQTTLKFFADANYSGASYTISLLPASSLQATQTVTAAELSQHALLGKVSSVQLICGQRPSRVSLFSTDWSEFSTGTMLECTPNHSAAVNLASVGYDNRIGAAALVADPVTFGTEDFSWYLDGIWDGQMQSLPDGVTANGTDIWLESWGSFRISQSFRIGHFGCTTRDAGFDLRVRLTTTNNHPTFTTTVMSTWVSYGIGDAWGCHDSMLDNLDAAASDAADQLDSGLPDLMLGVDTAPTFYFEPKTTTKDFGAFWAK